ncbi:MAG: GNAT family N-acetyltransferase [Acutalibacteraceae bacterium]
MYNFNVANDSDFRNLRDLWLKSFNDTKKGYNKFYLANEKSMRAYIAYDEYGKACASLYHLPAEIGGKKAHYLYGANTAPDYRNKGIMRGLIEFSLDDAKKHGESISVLYPADMKLYGFYKKLGYTENCFINKVTVSKNDLVHIAVYGGASVSLTARGMLKLRNELIDDNCIKWDLKHLKFAISYNKMYGGKTISSGGGYAILYSENDKVIVTELMCREKDMPVLLGEILRNTSKPEVEFHLMPNNNCFEKGYKAKYGLSRSLDGSVYNDIYIGLTCE